mgnify:CR=1 FL=1
MLNKYRIVLVENPQNGKYHFEVETQKRRLFSRTLYWDTIKTGGITKEPIKFYTQESAEKYVESFVKKEEKPTETRKVVEEYK